MSGVKLQGTRFRLDMRKGHRGQGHLALDSSASCSLGLAFVKIFRGWTCQGFCSSCPNSVGSLITWPPSPFQSLIFYWATLGACRAGPNWTAWEEVWERARLELYMWGDILSGGAFYHGSPSIICSLETHFPPPPSAVFDSWASDFCKIRKGHHPGAVWNSQDRSCKSCSNACALVPPTPQYIDGWCISYI